MSDPTSFANPAEVIRVFQESDRLGGLLGAQILKLDRESCLSEYSVSERHFNPNGILHGGALFSVMDSAQGAFVATLLDRKVFRSAVTGTATVKYFAPLQSGQVQIETLLLRQEGRKLFVRSQAKTAGKDGPVLVAELEEVWIAQKIS